ncbi:MAG: zinc ABC transporter substrate-binding protein [Betaproteobacteria bacterium]
MTRFVRRVFAALAGIAIVAAPAHAIVNVFATVPEWGALAQEIGGDKVSVYTATNALQDPHHVEAKPSLIARARSADLVVATGAELEIGWLPLVIRQAGNARVQPGRPGYLEMAAFVLLLDKPARLDRADGDVHAMGDPHIQTDPRNIAKLISPVAERLAALDPPNASWYAQRAKAFSERWREAIVRWEATAAPLRGANVVVQHKAFTYLDRWLGLNEIAQLEPRPGLEPTTAHLGAVLEQLKRAPVKMVLRAAYQNDRPSQWLADRTRIRVVALPFTVGGSEGAKDLFGLFEDTIARLLKGNE